MNIRTSSCITSSLLSSAFQTVCCIDDRGLAYRVRREIMTLRRLRPDPFPMPVSLFRGRIHASGNITTLFSNAVNRKVRT
jgi:hypothetical protein